MNRKYNYIVLGFLLACHIGNAQEKEIKKADTNYHTYAFAEAIDSYEILVKKGYTSEEVFKNLGNAYYQNGDYESAAAWLAKLFELEHTEIEANYMYKYAQTLKSLGKYGASDRWMQRFEIAKTNDNRAIKFADNLNYLNRIKENSGRYEIKNLPINSEASDFAPSFYGKEIVFSSARDKASVARNIHGWNNKSFLNLYRTPSFENSDLSTPKLLSKSLNKKTHESSTAFTKDGSTVYFTRNNSENGKFARDENGLSRLKIYRANLHDGAWKHIIELPFNADSYSAAHPTLSSDEKQLYFASDMPGTLGQSDIFVVDILEDGSFGIPKNLGNKINTEGRETFPFITESNRLYFASDGHPGLGGLDVFVTHLDETNYSPLKNIGEPINGQQDDFSFIIDESTKKGYFASSREGGVGSDDIYGLTEIKALDLNCITLVEGVIKDKGSDRPIAGSTITIMDSENRKVSETISNADGTFILENKCKDGSYRLTANKKEYIEGSSILQMSNANNISEFEIVLEKRIKRAAIGTDLVKLLEFSAIYFNQNKAEILPDAETTLRKIIAYMQQFPDIKVEVRSHTDAKGKSQYNKKLSELRALATVDFIVANGIAQHRITGQGLGETQLMNDCSSSEKCKDSKHRLNRRSEFIVIE